MSLDSASSIIFSRQRKDNCYHLEVVKNRKIYILVLDLFKFPRGNLMISTQVTRKIPGGSLCEISTEQGNRYMFIYDGQESFSVASNAFIDYFFFADPEKQESSRSSKTTTLTSRGGLVRLVLNQQTRTIGMHCRGSLSIYEALREVMGDKAAEQLSQALAKYIPEDQMPKTVHIPDAYLGNTNHVLGKLDPKRFISVMNDLTTNN